MHTFSPCIPSMIFTLQPMSTHSSIMSLQHASTKFNVAKKAIFSNSKLGLCRRQDGLELVNSVSQRPLAQHSELDKQPLHLSSQGLPPQHPIQPAAPCMIDRELPPKLLTLTFNLQLPSSYVARDWIHRKGQSQSHSISRLQGDHTTNGIACVLGHIGCMLAGGFYGLSMERTLKEP